MSPIESALAAEAELIRTPGSRLTDRLYREGRQHGLDEERSVLRVYLAGYVFGAAAHADQTLADSARESVTAMYAVERAAGRAHGEALDEVFLAGHRLGRLVLTQIAPL